MTIVKYKETFEGYEFIKKRFYDNGTLIGKFREFNEDGSINNN
jgi:hypothetical protein